MRPSSSTSTAAEGVGVVAALLSVTLLLSTIGICLRGCGDQFLEGFEEELLVGCVPGTEAGVEFTGAKLPADDQESVLFDEFSGHAVGFRGCPPVRSAG